MKQLGVLFLAALAATLGTTAGTQASNLLNNGGFEDPLGFDFSDLSNWNGFFGGPVGSILEAFNDTGAPARSGAQALELSILGNADEPTNSTNSFTGHAQLVTGIPAGVPVEYTAYARNNDSGLTGNVEFRLEYRDAGGVEISRTQILLENDLTGTYQPFTISDTTPAGTAEINAVIAVATFNQDVFHDHSVLFDDVSLTIIPEPTTIAMVGLAGLALAACRRS